MSEFRQGEWVIVTSQKGKKWLIRLEDGPFSCHLGTIRMEEVIGKEEGEHVETNKGAKLFFFRATLEDYIFKMRRETQIIYPKDLGAILFYGDVQPGDTVLESGIGSGSLSLALLRVLGDSGKLISVEKRPEFANLAAENIGMFYGYRPRNHHIVVADIQDFTMNTKVDRVVLDLPEPWHAVGSVTQFLRTGGIFVSLSPNIGQVQLTFRELKAHGYGNIITFELIKRDWMIDERRARPVDRMVSHTGFITSAKKIVKASITSPVE